MIVWKTPLKVYSNLNIKSFVDCKQSLTLVLPMLCTVNSGINTAECLFSSEDGAENTLSSTQPCSKEEQKLRLA